MNTATACSVPTQPCEIPDSRGYSTGPRSPARAQVEPDVQALVPGIPGVVSTCMPRNYRFARPEVQETSAMPSWSSTCRHWFREFYLRGQGWYWLLLSALCVCEYEHSLLAPSKTKAWVCLGLCRPDAALGNSRFARLKRSTIYWQCAGGARRSGIPGVVSTCMPGQLNLPRNYRLTRLEVQEPSAVPSRSSTCRHGFREFLRSGSGSATTS